MCVKILFFLLTIVCASFSFELSIVSSNCSKPCGTGVQVSNLACFNISHAVDITQCVPSYVTIAPINTYCNTNACVSNETNIVYQNVTEYVPVDVNVTMWAYFIDKNFTVFIPRGQNVTIIQYIDTNQTQTVYVDVNTTLFATSTQYTNFINMLSPVVNSVKTEAYIQIVNNTLVIIVYKRRALYRNVTSILRVAQVQNVSVVSYFTNIEYVRSVRNITLYESNHTFMNEIVYNDTYIQNSSILSFGSATSNVNGFELIFSIMAIIAFILLSYTLYLAYVEYHAQVLLGASVSQLSTLPSKYKLLPSKDKTNYKRL